MKQPKLNVELSIDDIAWVARKLNAHYAMIKKSTELTDEEKQTEIDILMNRAMAFGLRELVNRFGYLVFEVPLTGGREVQMIIPKNYTNQDLDCIEKQIKARMEYEKPELAK